jgi:uncharacterized protein YgbK (DUF1537 family)
MTPAPGDAPSSSPGFLAVVADDLTGAADTGAAFLPAFPSTLLLIGGVAETLPANPRPAAVSASVNSRHADPAEAADRVRKTAAALARFSPALWYKKIDSILRGNLGAEADALLDALDREISFVAPAFPAMGRTTESDVHRVNGTPVDQTEAARDPRSPVRESRLSRRIAEQSRYSVGHVDLDTLRESPTAAKERIESLRTAGVRHVAFDATESRDLDRIAALLRRDYPDAIPVGSAGLASALARRFRKPKSQSEIAPPGGSAHFDQPSRKILFVRGSASAVLAAQIDRLREQFGIPVVEFPADVLAAPETEAPAPDQIQRMAANWETGLALGIAPPSPADSSSSPEPAADADRLVRGLADWAAALIQAGQPDGLFLSGGDTAEAVLSRLRAQGLWLRGESVPGVIAGEISGGPLSGLRVWTKAGAFGSPQALVHLYANLPKKRAR